MAIAQKNEVALETFKIDLSRRPRRNRKSPAIRALVRETRLHPSNFVAPLFIIDGNNKKEEIRSMPGVLRLSIDHALKEAEELLKLGVQAVDLFIYVPKEKKNRLGSEAVRPGNLLEQAIKAFKRELPDLCVMVDIALDPFTDHGHDGIVDAQGKILNDPTLMILGEMCNLAAAAGADVVAPSDMMDGRIGHIRSSLDQAGFTDVSILSYAAKYASAFYGPFRDALQSAPKFGDKKTYQMDPANAREAMTECHQDIWEGADMLLIKPGLAYLDILARVREQVELPLGVYHVSGEYSMVMAAAQNGWIDGTRVMMECLLAMKRAGADFILTYAAKMAAKELLQKS